MSSREKSPGADPLHTSLTLLIDRTLSQSSRTHAGLRQLALDLARLSTLVATAGAPDELLQRSVSFSERLATGFALLLQSQSELGYLTGLVKARQLAQPETNPAPQRRR